MKRHSTACVVLLTLFFGFAGSAEAPQGPNQLVPELKPLEKWAGTWDITVTVDGAGNGENLAEYKGTATTEWVLNGYFLRQTYSWKHTGGKFRDIDGTVTMSYDLANKVFRRWAFASNGHMMESDGSWDAKKRTMTWTQRDPVGGVTITLTSTFPNDDMEVCTEVLKNREGKVLGGYTAIFKRRNQ